LIYEVLKEISDKNVYVGGNYGIPFVEILDKIEEASFSYQKPLDQEDNPLDIANSDKTLNKNNISTSHVSPLTFHVPPFVVVLELSSFQIYSTKTLKPKVSIILNISTDHLDWHKKKNIIFCLS
jgi:UDP-N-acetylmuramoylalanine-D-glutamate ligase